MTPRISLRPSGAAAVLITFAAVVLTLLSVTSLMARTDIGGPTAQPSQTSRSHQAGNATHSTASPTTHRVGGATAKHRATVTVLGQGAEIQHPSGGSPDVPATLTTRGRHFPDDLIDLPVDASAQVIATTIIISHRGRAPPISGYGI